MIQADYHVHSHFSGDSKENPENIIQYAMDKGLDTLCFTDHMDYILNPEKVAMSIDIDAYGRAYDNLEAPGLLIRRGVEFGLTRWNKKEVAEFLKLRV